MRSPDRERRQRPLAPSKARAAGPSVRSAGRLPHPHLRGRQLRRGQPRQLPETGRILQTLLEIHRHLHPAFASASPAALEEAKEPRERLC